jgi:hypothetical protein
MDIRSILNLIGSTAESAEFQTEPRRKYQSLLEAAWKLSYKFGYRSWYNPANGEFVPVVGINNHVQQVMKNPEEFGVTPEELQGATGKDRDPVVMNAVCAKGWIRVAGQNRNNPNQCMFFEGASASQMIKLLRMFWEDQGGELKTAAIKVRGQTTNKEYLMKSPEEVAAVAERGKLPAFITTNHDDTLKQ